MAFCKNCGTNLPDEATFCSECGTSVNGAPSPQAEQTQSNPNAEPVQNQETVTNNTQGDFDPTDVQNNKVMGVLAYIGLLVLIPIFAAKDSEYARFHAKQGTKLCILSIAYTIASIIINTIVSLIFRPSYFLFTVVPNPVASVVSTILSIASIFFCVLAIIGIVNACQGQRKELPIIDKLTFLDDLVGKFIK